MTTTKRIEKLLWPVFLVWSAVGLASIFMQADAATIGRMVAQPALQAFLISCFRRGDFIFHLLAAANLLLAVSTFLGWKKTWISFLVVAGISAVVETLGAKTGFPFGSYFYTENMGPLLDNTLPLAIPLAWWNILSPLYFLVRHFFPRLSSRGTCLAVALSATAMDWVMEPFAWRIKGYWIWESGSIPFQNYFGWFGLSFVLCRVIPMYTAQGPDLDKRILSVPSLMLTFFISARLIHGI